MKRWINLLQDIDAPILTTFWSVAVNQGSIWDLKCVYQTNFSNNISQIRLIGKLVLSNYSNLLSKVSISHSTSIPLSSRKMATTTTYPRKFWSWTHKTSLTPPDSTPGSCTVIATSITSSGSIWVSSVMCIRGLTYHHTQQLPTKSWLVSRALIKPRP